MNTRVLRKRALARYLGGKKPHCPLDYQLFSCHLSGWRKECKVSHDTQGGKKIECLWMNYTPQLTLF